MQSLARKKRYSEGWKRAAKKLAAFKRKQSAQRKDMHHKLSAKIADTYSLVAMEKLQISNMSKSAKGTIDVPGKNVAAKAGLNREILDTAPAMLMSMIRYKVEETGGE
jgi:putative transposase